MPKRGVTKGNLGATIDKGILKQFNSFCDQNSINKSNLIEKWVKKFLEGKK